MGTDICGPFPSGNFTLFCILYFEGEQTRTSQAPKKT